MFIYDLINFFIISLGRTIVKMECSACVVAVCSSFFVGSGCSVQLELWD